MIQYLKLLQPEPDLTTDKKEIRFFAQGRISDISLE